MTITPAVLAQLPLPDICAVIFYKQDEITTDLICCEVAVAGRVWTFHEESAGWPDLIAHLAALPSFRADWYEAVVSPPFATATTIAFDRRQAFDAGRSRPVAYPPLWTDRKRRRIVRMDAPALPIRYSYLLQFIATAFAASAFVIVTDVIGYRGIANAVGWFLPPVALAILMNRGWDRRVFMMMALIGLSLITNIVVGVNFTSYG